MGLNFFEKHDDYDEIRVAIIGDVSSGKSYLIMDMVQALRNLSPFRGHIIPKYTPTHHGIGNGNNATMVYAVRDDDYYEYKYQDGDKKKIIQILDMPGEAFINDEAKKLAYSIFKKMIDGKIMFKKIVGFNSKTGDTVSILSFGVLENVEANDVPQELGHAIYYSSSQIYAYYSRKGYNFDKKERENVSGEDVIRNFFDYNRDSIMSAIYDSKMLETSNESFKQLNREVYFWFYAMLSTHLVLCNLIASPDGQEGIIGTSLDAMLDMVGNDMVGNARKGLYLVYKGVDMVMDQTKLGYKLNGVKINLKKNGLDANDAGLVHDWVYAEFVYGLLKYFNNNCDDSQTKPAILNLDGVKFNIGTRFRAAENDEFREALNHQIYGIFRNFYRNQIREAADVCPYVFFASSAIDIKYNIHKNVEDDKTKFEELVWDVNASENRLCFGARQLLMSILNSKITIDEVEKLKECNKKLQGKNLKECNEKGKLLSTPAKLLRMIGCEAND